MGKAKSKTTRVIGIISIVAVLIVAGFSYYWANTGLAEKDDEIDSLNEEIRNLQEKFENTIEFTTLYLKARNEIGGAWTNERTADDYHDWGGRYYESDNLGGADEYWTYAMDFYSYAAEDYRSSRVLFGRAGDFAPTEDYADLMQKYTRLAESGVKLMDYLYQASEYLAATSRYYLQEKWEQGDGQLEKGNEFISAHDNEVPIYNDLLAEINVIEDLL